MPYASYLANYLLYTPFDSTSVAEKEITIKMTKKSFLESCYVKPQFKKELKYRATDENVELYDFLIDLDKLIDLRNTQKKDYNNFILWMNSKDNYKVYTISGNAGTGKTTLVRKLEYENKDKNWIILDLTEARNFIDWFNNRTTNIDNFRTPYNKMLSIVLEKLKSLLFINDNLDINISINHLKALLKIYKRKYSKRYLRGNPFFTGIDRIIRKTVLINNVSRLDKIAEYIKNYFQELINGPSSESIVFRGALDIMLIAACCSNENTDHIIVFDNLERFISHDEIYNADVDQIRKDLSSYSREVNKKSKVYLCNFKFIMGIRTSTSRMCGVKLHSADELPSDLNITDWYLIDDIVSSKMNWYKNHGAKIVDVRTINQILCDIRTCNKHVLTGLQLFVFPLFNENMRLITDFIGIIVEKESYKTFLEKYEELWNEDTAVSRFGARSIIKGLIYQELDINDNLFHHLQLFTEVERKYHDKNDDEYGLSYVRKILTVLYNKKSDVPLNTVLEYLCGIKDNVKEFWNNSVQEKTKDNICEVLYYMNSYNRRDNDWIQFVDMQINGKNKSTSIHDVQALKELISQNMNSINLRIMPAGEAYIRYIVPSFEFFSYRFYKNHCEKYTPFFAQIPSLDEINACKSVTELDCYKTLEYVKENALKCIENIKKNGDIDLIISENSMGVSHVRRIVNHHQGFIDNFVHYLKQKYSEVIDTNEKLNELINECVKIREQYSY